MNKYLIKIISIFLLAGLNWSGLSAVGQTISYYNDQEIAGGSFVASALGFSLSSPADFSLKVFPNATSSERDLNLISDESLPFKYKVKSENASGTLCDFLKLKADLGGTQVYNGALKEFAYFAGDFIASTTDWKITASLTSTDVSLQNQTCEFDFIFNGEQVEGSGFYDEEVMPSTISSGQWLKVAINKVYYDVCNKADGSCGDYKGKEKKNEWIELYNPTNEDLNLKKWAICNQEICKTINSNLIIPSLGYAILAHDNTTENYWNIPAEVPVSYQLDGNFEMKNDNDMLILKDKEDNVIDQTNWGTPTSTWPNYNDNVWPIGIPDADEGHMLARVPAGLDTDLPADWKDLGLPQAKAIWPNGDEVLWVGHYYDLKWNATNPNGPDSDLAIEIWYSNDSGNTWGKIVSGTENDGTYNWRVPLFINGDYSTVSHNARIKVMATGSENFMAQAIDISDYDFCPPIDLAMLTPEELQQVKALGLISEESGSGQENQPEEQEEKNAGQELASTEEKQEGGSARGITEGSGKEKEEKTEEAADSETEESQEQPVIITETNPAIEEEIVTQPEKTPVKNENESSEPPAIILLKSEANNNSGLVQEAANEQI